MFILNIFLSYICLPFPQFYWIPLYTTGCSKSYIESHCTLQGVLHHILNPTVHNRVFYIIYWIPLYTTGCSTSYIESCTLQGVLHHILNRAFSSRLGNHDKISLNHLKQIQKFAFGKYTIFEHSIRKTIKFDMGHSVQNLLIKLGEKSIYERGLWLKKRIQ